MVEARHESDGDLDAAIACNADLIVVQLQIQRRDNRVDRIIAELGKMTPALVAGADVAKGKWVVVVLEAGALIDAFVEDHLVQIRQRVGVPDILAVDIPIGLPERAGDWPRPSDLEAREILGPRRSSVFLAPPRSVFDEETFAAGNALHRRLTGKGISRQSWGLRDRVLEADSFVGENPKTIEAHPEVCFRAMKGKPLEHSKKTWNGQMERRSLLAAQGIELPDRLDDPVGKIPPDDILDATAAAWTAWRWSRDEGQVLPTSRTPAISDRGLIWF